MAGNFYIPRKLKIFIVFLLLISAAYLSVKFLFSDEVKRIPPDFLRARQEASLTAGQIIFISGQTAGHINQISDFDKNKQYEEALKLVSEELINNRKARDYAVSLSSQLEIMIKNIPDISPVKFGQIALEAISSETTLISRLITYNDYLVKLLEILQMKFLGKEKNANDKIMELIGNINKEAEAINSLNKNFNNLMAEFDQK